MNIIFLLIIAILGFGFFLAHKGAIGSTTQNKDSPFNPPTTPGFPSGGTGGGQPGQQFITKIDPIGASHLIPIDAVFISWVRLSQIPPIYRAQCRRGGNIEMY
jgi:hypothetical protein